MTLILSAIYLMCICSPRGSYLYRNKLSEKKKKQMEASHFTKDLGKWKFCLLDKDNDIDIYVLFICLSSHSGHTCVSCHICHSDLDFTIYETATLNSLTFIIGTIPRGIAIFVIKYIHITDILVIETHGLLLIGILCLFVGTEYKLAMWILAPFLDFFQ